MDKPHVASTFDRLYGNQDAMLTRRLGVDSAKRRQVLPRYTGQLLDFG